MITNPGRLTLTWAAMLFLALSTSVACSSGTGDRMAGSAPAGDSSPAAAATLANLQTAYNGESNAAAKYAAFASEADGRGQKMAGSLFRAAAKAEAIHASNHAEVIRKMGAEPKADVKPPQVGTTADNLRAAIEGESYERDTMYPDFIRQAREAGNAAAVRTMNLAKSAEAEHARLYQQTLAELGDSATPTATYYVCPVCGFTTSGVAGLANCPACSTKKDQFIVVS